MSHPVPQHKPTHLECLLSLILTPIYRIPEELESSKIYVKLDHDQGSNSVLAVDQMIQGIWENPLAHWVCKGMISVTASSSYPRILVYGEDQHGTLEQLGSIDVPKGRLPLMANQTAVIRGTLRLAMQSDQRPSIKVSYYVSLNILGLSDDGTIVASTPITNSPESRPSQTNPKILAAQGDELFELHFTDRNVAHLTSARSCYFDAVHFTPDNDPYRGDRLSKLAYILLNLFISTGDVSDLNEAIPIFENAVGTTPDGLSSKPFLLKCQGYALWSRHKRLGDPVDLILAISAYADAVLLTPDSPLKNPWWLDGLARNGLEVEEAIPVYMTAVRLTPDDDPSKPLLLNTLGRMALGFFLREGSDVKLNLAITSYRDGVHLTSDDDPAKGSLINDFANVLVARYNGVAMGDLIDLNEAITMYQHASRLADGARQENILNHTDSLLAALNFRFERLRLQTDLDQVILIHKDVLRSMGDDKFQGASRLSELGVALAKRYEYFGTSSDLHESITFCKDAVSLADTDTDTRKAEYLFNLSKSQHLLVWGQMLQLRAPTHELRDETPDLAAQFEKLSEEMESMGTNTAQLAGDDRRPQLSLEIPSKRCRQLTIEWETLVGNIRKVDGMDEFLLPKRVSQLAEAAVSGPVVVLNASEHRCDALIHKPNFDHVLHVPLCNFSFERAQAMQRKLKQIRSHVGVRQDDEREMSDERGMRFAQGLRSDFPRLLSELWDRVVRPVLDALDIPIEATSNPSRIWWCGTGPLAFLPIHAAGLYDLGSTADSMSKPLIQLSDIVMSSYTPSVTALLKTRKEQPSSEFKLLAVAQPSTPGQPHLPNTTRELAEIRKHLGSHSMMELEGADATIERVIESLSQCGWVHLACHGSQNRSDPTKSALMLEDGHLDIGRITRSVLPSTADFAFLSACQTASGDETLPEEVVHLAAGMLFAGYRSVIATMWSIRDKDAPVVADEVYRHLLSVEQPDSTEAARALHYAVARLRRESPEISFLSWVPFIHIGR